MAVTRWRCCEPRADIYDVGPGDVFWAASDVGWVVGHSYIVYAPLLVGATTVLYEGKPVGTPDPGAFWRVISEHGVKVLFTAPTAIRAIRKEDPDGAHLAKYDLSTLKYLFLAGEPAGHPDTYRWASESWRSPLWITGGRPRRGGQSPPTRWGWSRCRSKRGLRLFRCRLLRAGLHADERHRLREAGEEGVICLRLPLPPGTLSTLWGDDARFVASPTVRAPRVLPDR